MIILFSPSKTQTIRQLTDFTQPVFEEKAQVLLKKLRQLSLDELITHCKVSPKIADELLAKYQSPDNLGNALSSFTGTAFGRLAIEDYTKADWDFAQKHVRILSGAYGLLRPKDALVSYRLDVADNVNWMNLSQNLYQYWRGAVNQELNKDKVILGLASEEYLKMLSLENRSKVIPVSFFVQRNGQLKNMSVYSKQQRGSLLNFIIKNQTTDPTDIKRYQNDGFQYSPAESKEGLAFVRVD